MKTKLLTLAAFCGLAATLPAAEMNTLTPAEVAAGWHLLFDGKSIADWRASDQPGTFSVAGGEIVVKGPRSHLYYEGAVANHDFRNFELSVEVLTRPHANSGVYLSTAWQEAGWPDKGYEVQVNNSHSDPSRTGGLWGIQDNYKDVAPDNAWFTMLIRVEGRHITVRVDGKLVSDFTEPEAWTPPAKLPGRRLAHGTFALQGHDPGSETHFRNLKVRLLP